MKNILHYVVIEILRALEQKPEARTAAAGEVLVRVRRGDPLVAQPAEATLTVATRHLVATVDLADQRATVRAALRVLLNKVTQYFVIDNALQRVCLVV